MADPSAYLMSMVSFMRYAISVRIRAARSVWVIYLARCCHLHHEHTYIYGLENRIIRCPWHNWEFDITTGKVAFIPDNMWVKVYDVVLEPPTVETYPVEIEKREIVLYH